MSEPRSSPESPTLDIGWATFDAHRLLHLARDTGRQPALKERLLHATFTEGLAIADRDVLVHLAGEVGIPVEDAQVVLGSDKYADEVRADEQQAASYGISGVPFFVIDGTYGVSGAQSSEVLLQAMERAHADRSPLTVVTDESAPNCDGDACAI